MFLGSIALFLLAAILFLGLLLLPSLAMAQLQQQQEQQQQTTTTTTTTTPPSLSSLSMTTIPPLTPGEQEQQNRLQSTIAATTRDLNETEKQVSGIVFTPRWSEPVWINANSVSVLIAYCLPGEFADSGQEILGGFELEVLESYAVALPQGFMAWMAVVGNEDGNVRFPAALGVICASDLNNADTRILSPNEQQEINNINQQFSTVQNTQITNIDQVINIIDDVIGTPTQNGTGGGEGMTPTTEQPLRVEIITNATEAFAPGWIKFDSKVTGGTEPYDYQWRAVGTKLEPEFRKAAGFVKEFSIGIASETVTFILTVTDSKNQTASDSIQIEFKPRPLTVEIIPNATQGFTGDTIKFDSKVTGGTLLYTYDWRGEGVIVEEYEPHIFIQRFLVPSTYTVILTVTDSKGQTASDTVQIVIRERLGGGVLPPPETGQEGQPPGGGLLPGIAPGEEGQPQAPPTVPEEGEPTTGGEEDTGVTPPETGEEPSPPSPPPDDTGEEGEGTPPSTTEEEEEPPPSDDAGEEG